jgi:hypothetical protein
MQMLRVPSSVQPVGTRGYGKFYTLTDTANTTPPADFKPNGGHQRTITVLLEWTAKNPAAAAYDGGSPRELIRFEQPLRQPTTADTWCSIRWRHPAAPDFGLHYMGFADGGSGWRPAEERPEARFRIRKGSSASIPWAPTAPMVGYGNAPHPNPFVKAGNGALGEIYA